MKNTNRMSDIDKQWKEVFGGAEMTPSEGVWERIDSALSKQEAGYFKKRAFIYKLLAAASIIFALGVSIFSINYLVDVESEPVALERTNAALDTSNLKSMGTQIVVFAIVNASRYMMLFRCCFIFG